MVSSSNPTSQPLSNPVALAISTNSAATPPASTPQQYTKENFPYQVYWDQFGKETNVNHYDNLQEEKDRIYNHYMNGGGTWRNPNEPPPPIPSKDVSQIENPNIVPGNPNAPNQVNVADYAGQVVSNPDLFFNDSMKLSQNLPDPMNPNDPNSLVNGGKNVYNTQDNALNQTASTVQNTATVGQVNAQNATGYNAATTADQVANQDMQGAQGTVSQNSQVTPAQANMQGLGTGQNADGSVNQTGQALQQSAQQGMTNVIDTSTMAGKILADQLGSENYIDSKATLKGQLDILSKEFQDEQGNPKIPMWAQGTARGVSKIIAFSGMTGSAALASTAQALMEASLPIAQADSQFFQTITLQNLNNRQEATINRANVLAKFDQMSLDNRQQAAVQNAQSFLQMDMANLANDQQARVINTQNRVQSILEDAKAQNTSRLFEAQSQNEMAMFYDNLNSSISQFNASQVNGMSQYNTSQENAMKTFNAELENNRDQFYANMQYQIDTANAKWRQTITLTENQQAFDAATLDVKNAVGLSVEQLNRIWDRSDSLLDYTWKSSESAKDRKSALAIATLQAQSAAALQSNAFKQQDSAGWGQLAGNLISKAADSFLGSIF